MTEERWADVIGYEGLYKVSDEGRIKSSKRSMIRSNGRELAIKERILKSGIDRLGYEVITLYIGKKPKTLKVHRLVAFSFLENPKGHPQVNHMNGIKNDNRLINLEWTTSNGNQSHRYHVLRKQKNVHGKPRGISKKKGRNKWRSSIKKDGKDFYLGAYYEKSEALKRYFEAYKEFHGYEPWDLKEYPTH